MLRESESVEFKEILKDDIGKEVIAFANTEGGTIYIGIDDEAKEIGLQDVDSTYSRLTNIIRDSIVPDVTMHVRYELLNNIIKVTVAEGSAKPYFLKKNGMKPSGVYVRQGASSVSASWEQIRQFIIYADGDDFESKRSMIQDLTFTTAQDEFKRRNVELTEEKLVALGLRSVEKGLFTNLTLLLSDQCSHSVKVAVFDDPAKTVFIDRREFTGSLFKQLHSTYEYLALNNRTVSVIKELDRIDLVDYPPEAIREALLNAIIHRDYGYSGSILININREGMEFISLGGLLPGLSTNDILAGISQPRNVGLAHIFFRLKHIEAYGTGLRRIYDLYRNDAVKPEITVTENTFRIFLPNRNFHRDDTHGSERSGETDNVSHEQITSQMKLVLKHLTKYNSMTDSEIMKLLDLKRTRAYLIAKQMADLGLIDIIGRGSSKKYVLHDPARDV
jgi:ATP-dependent DNA helicase RecG